MSGRGLLSGALALGLLLGGCGGEASRPPGPRPNVLFLVADDLGVQLGAWGDRRVRTPHLDALARRGVRFERAYCQYPLCNPSRVSFLSGRLPGATGVLDNNTAPREQEGMVFLPRLFAGAGYHTARVGKVMHRSSYEKVLGWAVEANLREKRGQALTVSAEVEAAFEAQGVEELGSLTWRAVADEAAPLLADSRIADHAIERLQAGNERQPFFLAVGLTGPHQPFEAPRSLVDHYSAEVATLALPADTRPRSLPEPALKRARELDLPPQDQATLLAAYLAAVEFLDLQIGRILAELDRLELSEDTIVVFLSDHGYQLGENGGLWSKLTLFEEATRVPLIVAAPGSLPPATVPWPVELLDVYPTLVELAGIRDAPSLAGESLVEHMRAPDDPFRRGAFSMLGVGVEEPVFGVSVRTDAYRYTEWGGPEFAELYDHRVDPTESRNVVKERERRSDRKELQGRLRKLRDR